MKAAAKDESSGTPWRRISTILLFAGVLMAALAFANSGRAAVETPPPPSVWSDKADYAPGEQVTLSGANWAPGESVHIRVNDDAGETWRRDVDVTAAEDGAISDEFNLPDWFVAVYTVTATGASSGAVTWTFTDAVNTTTGVASSLNPSTSGGSVTFTSTTTCGSACTFPAGSSVRFVENANNGCNGGTLLGTATTLTGSGNSRQAAFTTSTLSAGAHSIRACFDSTSTSGSNAQSSVSAPMTQTVNSDTTPPDTSITSQPSNPSNSSSASFSFTGTDNLTSASSLTFECKLDAGAFTSCTSPKSYSGLPDGSHTFQVRATDAAGNTDATPASFTWFVDTTAPETSIDSNPSDPSSDTSASFTFSGTDNHSAAGDLTFECELDGAGFGSCSSPESYSALAEGSHTFKVRASDEAGNTDATPASYTWFVDTTAPDTTITAHPSNPSGSSSASFSFGGTDNHSVAGALTFRCELDGGGFGSCSSPKSYSGLGDGSHTFKVKATDEAGNTDATPDSFTWTVDTTGPSITLTTPPNGATYTQGQVVNASYSCSDSSGVATCIGTVANLAQINTATIGSKSFTVNATDALGNASSLTHNYSVVYNFSGFFSPVDNPPICNVVKAGQAVPIKFSLHGNQGMNIFAAGSPSSQPGTCSGLASDPLEETATAGQSTLNYDAQADQYAYVWKTEKSWSGTARLLTVTLADGTKHLARFTFTK